MKTLVVAIFCLVVSCVAFPVLALDGKPDTTMRLQSVQADFIQEKHLKILARPIISKGRFVFQAPQSLRWEYQEPFCSILLMHDGKIRKFIDREGQLEEERGQQLDAMQMVLGEISGWLEGQFKETETFSVSFQNEHTLTLIPKDPSFQDVISGVELKLADRAGVLDSVTIFEGAESFTRLVFSNAVVNQAIPATLLTSP